jgi:hypothetical protein
LLSLPDTSLLASSGHFFLTVNEFPPLVPDYSFGAVSNTLRFTTAQVTDKRVPLRLHADSSMGTSIHTHTAAYTFLAVYDYGPGFFIPA